MSRDNVSHSDPSPRFYVKLKRGRKSHREDMNKVDPFPGPTLGPFVCIEVLYQEIVMSTVERGDYREFFTMCAVDECVYFDGLWYGQYEITTHAPDDVQVIKPTDAQCKLPEDTIPTHSDFVDFFVAAVCSQMSPASPTMDILSVKEFALATFREHPRTAHGIAAVSKDTIDNLHLWLNLLAVETYADYKEAGNTLLRMQNEVNNNPDAVWIVVGNAMGAEHAFARAEVTNGHVSFYGLKRNTLYQSICSPATSMQYDSATRVYTLGHAQYKRILLEL